VNILRKIIAVVFIVFLAIPILFSNILAIGLTQATLNPSLFADIPEKIIAQLPKLVDITFTEIQKPEAIKDANARAWVMAASKVKTTPREILEKVGVFTWLQEELSRSLAETGKILRGESSAQNVYLNAVPLKKALESKDIDQYLAAVIQNLTACNAVQLDTWKTAIADQGKEELPACKPTAKIFSDSLKILKSDQAKIPDQILLAEGIKKVSSTGLLPFLVLPITFIIFGAYLFSSVKKIMLRVAGIAVFFGGIFSYLAASSARLFSSLVFNPVNLNLPSKNQVWSIEFYQKIIEKIGGLLSQLTQGVFAPVARLSLIVTALGVILFGLSFFIKETAPAKVELPAPKTKSKRKN